MAYSFTAASSMNMSTGSSPITAEPITIAAWFYRLTNTSQAGICALNTLIDSTTNRTRFLSLSGGSSNLIAVARDNNTLAPLAATNSSFPYSLNTWVHGCAVFASNSSRTAYHSGGNSGSNSTVTMSDPGLNDITIGSRNNFVGPGVFMNGLIAEVGIWNVALTVAEISSLSKGFACNRIRPQSLVFYAPLTRNLTDAKGRPITATNGPTVANHPRIYY